jgi:thymidine kinase
MDRGASPVPKPSFALKRSTDGVPPCKATTTVVVGPMYARKTSYVAGWVAEQHAGRREVYVYKPSLDTRDGGTVRTHDGKHEFPAMPVDNFLVMNLSVPWSRLAIVVEEAQFFAPGVLKQLVTHQRMLETSFLIVGLPNDRHMQPFGTWLAEVLSMSPTHVVMKRGTCERCPNDAEFTAAHSDVIDPSKKIVPGSDGYFPLCRACMLEHMRDSL